MGEYQIIYIHSVPISTGFNTLVFSNDNAAPENNGRKFLEVAKFERYNNQCTPIDQLLTN